MISISPTNDLELEQFIMIEIKPKFYMHGWRTLRSTEEVKDGDYYWSRNKKTWLPVVKHRIGNLAIKPYTFVRKELSDCDPGKLPPGYQCLRPEETIKKGDYWWAISLQRFLPCIGQTIGKKVGNLVTTIRKV